MANKKRKQIEKYILDWIYKITKLDYNVNMYKDMFKKMSDKEFDEFMHKLKNGKLCLQVVIPNDKDFGVGNITVENNIKLAKELGYKFSQQLVIGPKDDIPAYKTPEKFLVLDLPFRRTKQTAEKGLSYAENMSRVDPLTGQPTGDSMSTRISFPELQVLIGLGFKRSLVEILRDRGGDTTSMKVLLNSLTATGNASQAIVGQYSTGVLSTIALKNYLLGMHLKNTL